MNKKAHRKHKINPEARYPGNLLKKAEERFQVSEDRYKSLFDRSFDLIYVHDFEGRFIDANYAALKRLGYKKQEISSLNFASFLSKNQIPLASQTIKNILAGTQKDFTEFKLRHKDGSDVYVETRGYVVTSNGKPLAIQAIARDITERKLNEEALRQRQKELSLKSRNLEEMNSALKVLLKYREDDRIQIEENVLTNVKTSILPYIEKLKKGSLTKHQRTCLKMLEGQIKDIISPFLRTISQSSFDLTPQELRVADLVKNGNTTKEIAGILRISVKTVDYHRDNLRRKLGIKNNKANLRSFLLKFS